ncbi:MAG: PAS domain S-box protein [Planctomycetota bacterium]
MAGEPGSQGAVDRESLLRSLFENLSLGITLISRQYDILLVNPHQAELFGKMVSEMQGKKCYEVFEGRKEVCSHCPGTRAMQSGQPAVAESEGVRDDGQVIPARIHALPYRDRDGRTSGFIEIIENITEQKRAEREAHREKVQLRSIFRAAPVGIGVTHNRVLVEVNERLCSMLGHTPDELIGQSARILYPSNEDYEFVGREKYEQIRRQGTGTVETRFLQKDGRILDILLSSTPLDPDDLSVGVTFTALDITARKRAEDALRFTHFAVEHISDSAFWMGPDARFIYVNEAACKALGYSRDELLRMTVHDIDPDLPAELWEAHWQDLRERGSFTLDSHHRTKSGEVFPVEVSVNHVVFGGREFNCAVVRDIRERKRIERERHELDRQIQRTQKLESLGVMAGGIAHDFNNLLVAILGNADLASGMLAHDSPVLEHLEEINLASQRAADLCRQMLAYSGKGRFIIEAVDLSRVAREMAEILQVSRSRKVALRYQLSTSLPAVEVDVTQIRQVIMNLVTNACEAIGEESGLVTITTCVRDCEEDELRGVTLGENLSPGRYVALEVSDNGCGMDADMMSRIFEPFFTSKFAGRGLGLAAVLGIVRGHKGAIRVFSELGQGTGIEVFLPACERGLPAAREDPEEATTRWRGEGVVLLVDDDAAVRRLATRMLGSLGFEVLSACDGEEAVELYRREAERVSLVLLDLTMPRMEGGETLRALKRIQPDVRVVLASGYDRDELSKRYGPQGALGFLQKPYELKQLRSVLEAVLG